MTSITRYKLRKLLKYGLVAVGMVVLFGLYSGDLSVASLGGWFLLGLWTGVLEEFLFGRRFRSLAVPLQVLGKVLAVNALTLLLLLVGFYSGMEDLMPGGASPVSGLKEYFSTFDLVRVMLRVVIITTATILLVQLEELMGRRMFLGYVLGRYERPTPEERVMLTLDLVGSTTLAEKMGDLKYFRFLNTTYSLMTDAVLRNEAQIHKYIGDEVIFSWPMRIGVREQNCLDLYFDIVERLEEHAQEMNVEFGELPRYRAAVHGGRVISAQIGHIKRAIEFSGDVMNTVSRMLGASKELGTGLLVSAELLDRIPDVRSRFEVRERHVLQVRGRKREVVVHPVLRTRKA
ncbi:MAG: adenylate/guanylate cyclase domain-containing protein [Flavobacteriales bacterium]|nr:adenylate/guanylate cyclase domain-containing protein [Flavobacteriales bacterium]